MKIWILDLEISNAFFQNITTVFKELKYLSNKRPFFSCFKF